ncbi:hypothetical protein [Aliivibrio sp.]|uniref:hypothetical protein n=1 Tax=Aliivibrio sp. TaxID=1872443 RepID=UPI003D2EC6FD
MKDPLFINKSKIAFIGECMIELCGSPFKTQQQHFGGNTLAAEVIQHKGAITPKSDTKFVIKLMSNIYDK